MTDGFEDPDELDEQDELAQYDNDPEDSVLGSIRRDFPGIPPEYDAAIDEVAAKIHEYNEQRLIEESLVKLFKWSERDGFELDSIEEIMPFLEKRKKIADQANMAAVGTGQKGILNDTAIYIQTAIDILNSCQDQKGQDPPIPLRAQLEVMYEDHKTSWSQRMSNHFRDVIIDLEKMRLLVCKEDPEKRHYPEAGDLVIRVMTIFFKIIKPEILKNIVPPEIGESPDPIRFGTDLKLQDLRDDDIGLLPGPYDEENPQGEL